MEQRPFHSIFFSILVKVGWKLQFGNKGNMTFFLVPSCTALFRRIKDYEYLLETAP